jgi:hypothetical protein
MMYHDMSSEEQLEFKRHYLKAAKDGDIEYFIDCMDRQVPIEIVDDYGDTALHIASRNGNFNIVEYLVENCCNIHLDVRNDKGKTALHFASILDLAYRRKYSTGVVVMLLQRLRQPPKQGLKRTI